MVSSLSVATNTLHCRAVHQTTTLRRLLDARAVLLHGSPTAQDSWFPGYAWTIASCARCLNHLGWKFTLVQEAPNRLVSAEPVAVLFWAQVHRSSVIRAYCPL
jgi:hypothetical protein